jgi:hypothetical protein
VSRKFCLLPQFYSERDQFDCKKHSHLNAREVESLDRKSIRYLDLNPRTHKPRYIELPEQERADFVDPSIVQSTQKTHLAAGVIRTAAGAIHVKAARVRWRGAGKHESHARNSVAAHGAERREFARVVAHERLVELRNFAWTEDEVHAGFKEDKFDPIDSAGNERVIPDEDWMPKGALLRVALKARTPEALEIATAMWRFMNAFKVVAAAAPGSNKLAAPPQTPKHLRRGPFQPGNSEPQTPWAIRPLRKDHFRQQEIALDELDRVWPAIVAEYQAGPHSEDLNVLRPSELPSSLLTETLRAYLLIPSDRWSEVES